MKFPRRSLRLFIKSKSSLKKRIRFRPEEVKDHVIDLSLSSNGTGSCHLKADNLKSATDSEDIRVSSSQNTSSQSCRDGTDCHSSKEIPSESIPNDTPVDEREVVMHPPSSGNPTLNEEMVTGGIQNEKHSPLVSCGHKRDAKSLTKPGCLSGCAEERPEDDEEDCLTIAQLLSRSKKTESSTKKNDRDDEPLPDVCSKIETPAKVIYMNEPLESSGRSLCSSGKSKNSDSPAETQKESEARKIAVASEANLAEANNDDTELAKEEVVREANTVNGEEEIHDKTAYASELPPLGLKARILRLETIFNMIKAEKNVASSREI